MVGSKETAELVHQNNMDVEFRPTKKPTQMRIRIKNISEYNDHRELLHSIIRSAKIILEH